MPLKFLNLTEASAAPIDWPDAYFSPEYGAAAEVSDGGRWELAVWEPGPILYPYLVHEIEPIEDGNALSDIRSPYGYAGSWAPPDVTPYEWRRFRSAFREAAAQRGIVSEFQRLTPLLPGVAGLIGSDDGLTVVNYSETAVVDLQTGFDAWWTAAEGRVRTAVRKAERTGHEFAISPASHSSVDAAAPFRELYEATMDRVGADDYFRFSGDYYRHLVSGLGSRLWLGQVLRDGQCVAAALFIWWNDLLHYHLAGSDRDAARQGANALLVTGMIRQATARAASLLHLGGGLRPGDGLWTFKRGFATRSLPFRLATSVLLPGEYAALTSRAAAQLATSEAALKASGYFPAYRARPALTAPSHPTRFGGAP